MKIKLAKLFIKIVLKLIGVEEALSLIMADLYPGKMVYIIADDGDLLEEMKKEEKVETITPIIGRNIQ